MRSLNRTCWCTVKRKRKWQRYEYKRTIFTCVICTLFFLSIEGPKRRCEYYAEVSQTRPKNSTEVIMCNIYSGCASCTLAGHRQKLTQNISQCTPLPSIWDGMTARVQLKAINTQRYSRKTRSQRQMETEGAKRRHRMEPTK